MNETQLWYCDICDKTNNFKIKPERYISKSQIRKKEYGTIEKIRKF